MLANVFSRALAGLEGAVVEVEADINTRSLPSVTLVGLPDAAVKKSTERVRAAFVNAGLSYPPDLDGALFVGELSLKVNTILGLLPRSHHFSMVRRCSAGQTACHDNA